MNPEMLACPQHTPRKSDTWSSTWVLRVFYLHREWCSYPNKHRELVEFMAKIFLDVAENSFDSSWTFLPSVVTKAVTADIQVVTIAVIIDYKYRRWLPGDLLLHIPTLSFKKTTR